LQNFALKNNIDPLSHIINKTKLMLSFKKRANKKEVKGLVGIIAVEIKQVNNIILPDETYNGLSKIYFAEEGGDYDTRNTKLASSDIDIQCENVIDKHYDVLEKKIIKQFKDNPIFYTEYDIDNSKNEKRLITSVFKDLYSSTNIKKHILKVNEGMNNNNAIHFIGDKIGLKGFSIEHKILTLDVFQTDHFTWQVFKEIFKEHKTFFQDIMLRVNRANYQQKQLLIENLAFVFSSIGIDIIIEGKSCNTNKRGIIIAARSGKIETDKRSTLHVSVNECFTKTDTITNVNSRFCGLYSCVRRGIQEELGIKEDLIKDHMIKFHDFAIVTDEAEIGLSCRVDLSKSMPLEQVLLYPGQDKYLEIEEFVILPYPKINHFSLIKSVDSKKYMRLFYKTTLNDRFNMPWMSFTPLLISRIFIRNIRFNFISNTLYFVTFFGLLFLLTNLIAKDLTNSAIVLSLNCLVTFCTTWFLKKRKEKQEQKIQNKADTSFSRPTFIQPFVSQWYGNVKVVQSSGYVDEELIAKGITMGIRRGRNENYNSNGTNMELPLSQFVLKENPYCAIRNKKSGTDFSEMPISFYELVRKSSRSKHNTIHFYKINSNFGSSEMSTKIAFSFITDEATNEKKINNIKFTQEVPAKIEYNENSVFNDEQLTSFQRLFKLNRQTYKNYRSLIPAFLSESFKSKYIIKDLFVYHHRYYWSCVSKNKNERISEKVDLSFSLSKASNNFTITNFYNSVMCFVNSEKKDKGTVYVKVDGAKREMEDFLSKFISHPNNRRRISELDLYMLQLYCIRESVIIADIDRKDFPKYTLDKA